MKSLEEIIKEISELSGEKFSLALKLDKIRNIVESGMNDTQKLIYIKGILEED